MRAWTAAPVSRLPGGGLPLRVYDTASQQVRPVAPGPLARMYVCGITPYDATHLGHAATYVAFDLLHRVWLDAGHDVFYVQNVTDVDDPLLERAAALGEDWAQLADRQTTLFREDMEALRVLPPQAYVGAVEAIPQIAERVRELRDRGAAYDLEGDVYFSVSSDPRFGAVSNLDAAAMLALFAERGGDPDRPGKKDPLDPLLWLAERPGEPAWDSPLGRGRPGWHVECTTIAIDQLGMSFDIQGGGTDLIFPHHEMSAAHGTVLTGEWPFARAYVHAGMVGLDGAKMSKSCGNLVFVSQLRAEGVDPMALRLALLAHHYRSDWSWTPADLSAAEKRLGRWREAISMSAAGPSADQIVAEVRRHLADDLNAPAALTVVDRWCEQARLRGGSVEGAPALVATAVDALLGLAL